MQHVGIVAAYPTTQFGLRAAVEQGDGWEVAEVVRDLNEIDPDAELDALLADIDWDDEELGISDLLAELPPLLLLVDAEDFGTAALEAGARGVLVRDVGATEITAALTAIAAGLIVLDERIQLQLMPQTPSAILPAGMEPLTPREIEVLELIACGEPNKGIARELNISEHTVKFHVGSILTKLAASSRSEALARAIGGGLISI